LAALALVRKLPGVKQFAEKLSLECAGDFRAATGERHLLRFLKASDQGVVEVCLA
jgi:hypothetical protein